jgi:hypothetical protein
VIPRGGEDATVLDRGMGCTCARSVAQRKSRRQAVRRNFSQAS